LKSLAPEWQNVRRILCVRLDTLGDVLMTTPAMRAFKDSLAGSSITLLTSTAGAEVGRYIPEVDEVIVYESPWMKSSPEQADSQHDMAMLRDLRARQFDAAVIFTVYSQNPLPPALFCYLADIPLRLAHCRENPYKLLTHWVKEIEPEQIIRHEVQRQLDLAAAVGCTPNSQTLSFQVPIDARAEAVRQMAAAGIDLSSPWIALHPGVSAPSRQYRPEGYAQAASQLAQEDGFQIVFTGTEGEQALVEQIQGWMSAPSFSLAGQLSLGALGAVLEMAPLLISNNTGPVHVAAALGTPIVDLYALTNPQHTPWAVPHRVLYHDVPCKFCYRSICPEGHHNCLRLVEPQEIVQAVRELLAETSTPPHSPTVKSA
jgi:lipopolysaccharide heptosyltransferase II